MEAILSELLVEHVYTISAAVRLGGSGKKKGVILSWQMMHVAAVLHAYLDQVVFFLLSLGCLHCFVSVISSTSILLLTGM